MALTRIEKALSMAAVPPVPRYFEHMPTLGKPTPPSTVGLDASDQQRFDMWKVQRESGTLVGSEEKNASPALVSAMQDFEDYLATPIYKNWMVVDSASRTLQWRLMLIDVGEAVNAKSTSGPTSDSAGIGKNAINTSDVGLLGGDVSPFLPEYVTNGDPNNPELVFGDDGDVVTVQ
jgi:hypothetical protein